MVKLSNLCLVRQVNDTIKVDLETGKPIENIKFEIGNVCMISRGRNAGRVGIMQHIERSALFSKPFCADGVSFR